jgi:hypothetical protein
MPTGGPVQGARDTGRTPGTERGSTCGVRGYEFEGYERTVDSHVKNLRHKIEDDPANPEIVQTVLGGGYRLGLTRDE